ncbi:MAG: hypothetical protein U9R39_08420 [Campylobacterota bacterium]|nr:hypothetical protein [Campylobacterota bacterium]
MFNYWKVLLGDISSTLKLILLDFSNASKIAVEDLTESELTKLQKKAIISIKILLSILVSLFVVFGSYEAWRAYADYSDKREAIENINKVSTEIYFKDQAAEVALEMLKNAQEMDQNDVNVKYTRAFIETMTIADKLLDLDRLYTAKELKEAQYALANAEFLLQSNNNVYRADGYFAKSQIYLSLDELDKSLSSIELALKEAKTNFPNKVIYFTIRKATILIEKGQDKIALKILDDSIEELTTKRSLSNEEKFFLKYAYNWKGYVNMKLNGANDPLANSFFLKALEIDNKFSDALYNYTEYLLTKLNTEYKREDIFKIESNIQKLLKIDPDNKSAYYLWSMLYGKVDQYDTSLRYVNKALEIDEGYFTAVLLKGRILYELKKYNKASEVINLALSLKPNSIKARYRNGVLNYLMKNYKEANNDFNRVIYFSSNAYYKYKSNLYKFKTSIKEAKESKSHIKTLEKEFSDYIDGEYYIEKYTYCVNQKNINCQKDIKQKIKDELENGHYSSKYVISKMKEIISK